MFKTDDKSLDKLSFAFDERDIANFKYVMELVREEGLQTISKKEFQRIIEGLDAIGKRKLNKRIYAFHVYDSYAEEYHNEGVELYIRQGDKLEEFCVPGDRDSVFSVRETVKDLKSGGIIRIYTGRIPHGDEFLGVCGKYKDPFGDVIIRNILSDSEIEEYRSSGIKVIKLDSLI